MGYTRKQFFDLLPHALSGYAIEIADNYVAVEIGNGSAKICVGDETERRFTPFVMFPVLPVEIQFVDVDVDAKNRFIEHFDRAYTKGLG